MVKQKTEFQVGLWSMVKSFLTIFLPSLVLVGSILMVIYNIDVKSEKAVLESKMKHQVVNNEEVINTELRSVVSDMMFLSNTVEMQEFISSINIDETEKELVDEFRSFCKAKPIYDQIRILNETGKEVVRVNCNNGNPYTVPAKELQFKGEFYYFKETFSHGKGGLYVSPLDLNIEQGEIEQPLKPVIRFGTPLIDIHGQKKGVFILNYLGAGLIRDFKRAYADSIGHIMLLNPEGFWLIGMKPEDEWGFMYEDGGNKTIANSHPKAWQQISREDSGQFRNANGLFTFTTVYPHLEAQEAIINLDNTSELEEQHRIAEAETYHWKVVSHVMPGKLRVALRKSQGRFFQISAILILLLTIGSFFLASASVRRKQAEVKLKALSLTDELTDLYNRRGFFALAEHQLEISKREKMGALLLYADLDNLKGINDALGHHEGDLVLIEAANILKTTFRKSDIIARIGGDEFVVFPVGTTEEHAGIITARLQKNLEIYNATKKDHSFKLSISIGIAHYDPKSTYSVDDLLADADKLMYEQKMHKKKS